MKPLCIRDALSLYKILKPHLPEEFDRNETGAEFVKSIVDSMAESDPDAYLKAVMLMSGNTKEQLQKKYKVHEVLGLFIDGLIQNQAMLLVDFGKRVGL